MSCKGNKDLTECFKFIPFYKQNRISLTTASASLKLFLLFLEPTSFPYGFSDYSWLSMAVLQENEASAMFEESNNVPVVQKNRRFLRTAN